jgi:hypothetical protein
MGKKCSWIKILSHLATGIFIKRHPGSISIWAKTIPQKGRAVVSPEINNLFIEGYDGI